MSYIDFTSDSHKSALPGFSEPPLQEVTQPAWKERKGLISEWGIALIVAFAAALLIRTFFFEAFRIPSESMENTLLVGDFVLVSKVHYGPRFPITVGVPFTNIYSEQLHFPHMRLPGFKRIQRNDVIVFNVPSENQPIDRKTHYIKRVIGLPGDAFSIVNKVPVVNGDATSLHSEIKHMWWVYPTEGKEIPIDLLEEQGIYQIIQPRQRGGALKVEASISASKIIASWAEVSHLEPVLRGANYRDRIFPSDRKYSLDNYGPIYIPQKGDSVELSNENWTLYKDIITRYEGNQVLRVGDNAFHVNGNLAKHYVFEQDYFFVMGDNRDSSLDSRTWGFVPKDHIVGKALVVYFSWNRALGETRTDRILKKIE